MRQTTVCVYAIGVLLVCLVSGCTPNADQSTESVAVAVTDTPFKTGAEVLSTNGFEGLAGKRVGMIVNHTAKVGDAHLIDVIHEAPNVELVALFGPEHGIRGDEDAGALVDDGIDEKTGVPVYSLYSGQSRRPAPESLQGLDVLVFDIQDIGARFYTYISTMGLAMQAAAEQGIAFMVLDRPNPLGGMYVAGYTLEPSQTSFVGQYPVPIAHGLTVGELALMVQGEPYLDGLDSLDLQVVAMEGWERSQTWTQLDRPWIPTSPNIPDVETAWIYPGMCFFEAVEVSEGRGTRAPFRQVGASWANADELVEQVAAAGLPGVRLEATHFVPESIEGMASNPRFLGEELAGVQLSVTDWAAFDPVATGVYILHAFYTQSAGAVREGFFNERWLARLAGTHRLQEALIAGESPEEIVAGWDSEVEAFRERRTPYLLYEE